MESPEEPLCKGRNQIVIIADNRVPQWSNIQGDTSLLKKLRLKNFQTTNGTENSTDLSYGTNSTSSNDTGLNNTYPLTPA